MKHWHREICFTTCLFISPDLDGHRAPQMTLSLEFKIDSCFQTKSFFEFGLQSFLEFLLLPTSCSRPLALGIILAGLCAVGGLGVKMGDRRTRSILGLLGLSSVAALLCLAVSRSR